MTEMYYVCCAVRIKTLFCLNWRPGFDHGPVLMKFVVDKLALGEGYLRVLLYSSVSLTLPLIHTHPYLNIPTVLTRKTSDHAWEPENEEMLFRVVEYTRQKSTVALFFSSQRINVCNCEFIGIHFYEYH
jgi:hypothetical protein